MSESKNYITPEGLAKLKAEYHELLHVERPRVVEVVAWAASNGDRSENADYHYNKKLLRQIDRRIRYLTKRFEELKIVDYSPQQDGKVFFGAWVEIENEEGETLRLRIVGPDEIYERKDYISIDAPMARALLKREMDEEAIVDTPSGKKVWLINKIWYTNQE